MGLSLRTGATATFGGTSTPMTPPAASTPGAVGGKTIAQQAYGVMGTGGGYQKKAPGYGTLAVGGASILILAYIYWSLPR